MSYFPALLAMFSAVFPPALALSLAFAVAMAIDQRPL